jgi:chromate reductase, NAD(P)H dehydrogenase (quinone)
MDKIYDVGVFVGSLRKDSFSRKMAQALFESAPPALKLGVVAIGELELYNEDLEERAPENWLAFRRRVRSADALLFVTPEYNRSVPAVLKNAIDVGSRPYGKSVWAGKPGAVVSVSPSPIGAFGANHHLRQSMVFLNVPMMQQPEAYIGGAADLFNAQGKPARESTAEFLRKFMQAFAAWIARNSEAPLKSS